MQSLVKKSVDVGGELIVVRGMCPCPDSQVRGLPFVYWNVRSRRCECVVACGRPRPHVSAVLAPQLPPSAVKSLSVGSREDIAAQVPVRPPPLAKQPPSAQTRVRQREAMHGRVARTSSGASEFCGWCGNPYKAWLKRVCFAYIRRRARSRSGWCVIASHARHCTGSGRRRRRRRPKRRLR